MSRQYGMQRAPGATAIDIEPARLRGENDYKINLKAELEIRHLQENSITFCGVSAIGFSRFRKSRFSYWKNSAANAKVDPPCRQRSIIVPRISG
jgi:hypothetical protein